ncbi:hypothetical protein AXF42_Ash011600 [Apostasia shenzhenica]|uniref:Integrase catalytic domain-containing protein n=1 Tax=Apostasia shenzhenica TaxID=1088818 RepID=A0A2I0BB19_9ASPA|nr:hypothetical protein AXF42_Ash011600 [Apostasia shenzhenica]
MDFVIGLPRSQQGRDAIWVVVDRLTKSAHFLPIKTTDTAERLTKLYVEQIIRLHGIPKVIISDRDSKFTSHFWKKVHTAFSTELKFSTAFHPQTDEQTERTIQTLEDLLRMCVLDFGGSWEDHLALIEFAYNDSYQTSIGMAPYEALYGRRCQSPVCWFESGERAMFGPELVDEATEKVKQILERLQVAQDRQKKYYDANHRHVEFEVDDHVFLKVSPMKGVTRFGKIGKLKPRFIGPFQILERVGTVAYRVALPPHLAGVHDVFHVSSLKKHVPDPTHIIRYDPELMEIQPNLCYKEVPIRILAKSVEQLRSKQIPMVKILWKNQEEREATWEVEDEMRKKFPGLF